MNFKSAKKCVYGYVQKNSPSILIGVGLAGLIMSTIAAVEVTPKALSLIEEAKKEKEKLTNFDKVKATWKCYIPSAIMTGISVVCIVGASSIFYKRNQALATVCVLSESALQDYRRKVIETIGEKKEQAVQDAVAKEKIEKQSLQNVDVIETGHGKTLCFDAYNGRYFKSDKEWLRRAENNVNKAIVSDGFAALNDFYYDIGLPEIKLGYDIGWSYDQGLMELIFSSQLANGDTPCLVVDFSRLPKPDPHYY